MLPGSPAHPWAAPLALPMLSDAPLPGGESPPDTRQLLAHGSIHALTPSIVTQPLGTLLWGFEGFIRGTMGGSLHQGPPLMGTYPGVQILRGWRGRGGRLGHRDGDGKQ